MKHIKELEQKIIGLMNAIKNGTKTKAESGIGKLFTKMKKLDEALYDELFKKYKEI